MNSSTWSQLSLFFVLLLNPHLLLAQHMEGQMGAMREGFMCPLMGGGGFAHVLMILTMVAALIFFISMTVYFFRKMRST